MMATTLKAMKRIQEIKTKRERVHHKNRYIISLNFYRMAGNKDRELAENIKQLQSNIELIDQPELKQRIMENKVGVKVKGNNDMELV
jgi:large subunit ribosomal protein L24e